MSGLIPDSFIDDLLARVDIVDVIEHRVPLKRAGREWVACCPFHDERSPSFSVSPTKQFYHCFGCGAHGSAIRFVMEYDRLEFPDAVEELAQTVGLQVPRESRRDAAPQEDKTDLYELLDAAANWYAGELPRNHAAQAYCAERGLAAETIERFRLGWAPAGFDGVIKALGRNARRMHLLTEAGMVAGGDHGRTYDRFRERLMFPILDRRGRVIAFGGRIISSALPAGEDPETGGPPVGAAQPGAGPKYLNSPETPLFHKGRELFAMWQVRQANKQLARIVVVEGYMDAIALHQAGLPIGVATLGTATTPDHAELLFRAAPDVVFCFDGDRAGRAAAWKALDAALPRLRDGRQAWFLFLPDGEDPDSLVRKEGKAAFEQRIREATPLSEYFFNELGRDVDVASLDGRARLAERSRPLIARLPDGAFRDLMEQELEKRSGVRPQGGTLATARPTAHKPVQRSLVRSAIALLLAQPELASLVDAPYAFLTFDKPGVGVLAELLDLARARPGVNTAMLVEHFAGRPEYGVLQTLASATAVGDAPTQAIEFHEALQRMCEQASVQRRSELTGKSRSGELDAAEKMELRQLLAARTPPSLAP
ncbi:MAG: DNA primase [Rhodanobacter sp.]